MREQMLFYLVFLSQVLVVSYVLPRQLLGRVTHVVETYPPSTHPKLYPAPIEATEKARRNYRLMNLVVLLIGLALVAVGIFAPSEDMLGWDTISVLTIYMVLQWAPMIIVATAGFTYFNLKRATDRRTTRRATLQPRRLFDFVSPVLVGLAVVVYVAFVGFVLYVRQFDYPWFGGYMNIVGITAGNLLFVGLIIQNLHGKKKDPFQASDDRLRQTTIALNLALWTSIVATLFIAFAVTLSALELSSLIPMLVSVYAQLLSVASFRTFRTDNIDFGVYKADPVAT